MFRKVFYIAITGVFFCFYGCKDDVVPKPEAYLRLDYNEAEYATFSNKCPYSFDINDDAEIEEEKDCSFKVHYPKMKATVYLTYKSVHNNIDSLLKDAQKLTYKHVIKADDILEQPFINTKDKVYGMFYRVGGNAATNAQFYVTDSTKHFIAGSVYFYAKPNFDSIMPAADYITNDMRRMMETMKWK